MRYLHVLADRLRTHVITLAGRPRPPGSAQHDFARQYIRRQLEQAGFVTREGPFSEAGFEGVNLLTEPLPERVRGPLLIIGAHYDSVAGSPGADDNASAVAGLLELARSIRPVLDSPSLSARLQLAAYDLEEYGLVGSFIHSRELERQKATLLGMISLEMLGYTDHRPGSQRLPLHLAPLYPDVGDFIGVCGNEASRELLERTAAAMKTIDGLPVQSLCVPGNGEVLFETRLSDHSSFWDRGFKGLMITDTAFFRSPHYHQSSDTPDTLDYTFLARVTAGVTAAVRSMLADP